MKKLFSNFEVPNNHMHLLNGAIGEKERFEEYIKLSIVSDMSRYMLENDIIEFDSRTRKIQYDMDVTTYTGKVRVISAEDEKSLKQCYNALTEFDDNPYLRDIKDKIAKILWEE